MKKIFFIILSMSLIVPLALCAMPELSPDAMEISNQVMMDFYQGIIAVKADYPDLQNFGPDNLVKNDQGLYVIRYMYPNPRTGEMYGFGLTVSAMDVVDFEGEEGRFYYGFPKINLKISGFQKRHALRTQFDVMPMVPKHGIRLAEYQQKFMPLQMRIIPARETFSVAEEIEFDVILENVSKRHMRIKSLGKDTLYFLMNDSVWGTNPLSGQPGGADVVLRSGDKVQLRLRGKGFDKPQAVDITGFYGMSIDGVNPMGKAKIVIQE